jgi:large repetitive protein
MNDLFAESGRQATHGHFMTTPAGSGQSRIGLASDGVRFGHDHLGSVALRVGVADGEVIGGGVRMDVWGGYRRAVDAPGGLGGFGLTGHWWEAESGLVYAEARWLDPGLGLFLSVDPFAGELGDPRSLGRFHYASGNPVAFWDPDGRCRYDGRLPAPLAPSSAILHFRTS